MKTESPVIGAGVWLVALVAIASACAPQIHAQVGNGPPPAEECRMLANKLASDPHSEAFRQALRSNIAACGETGAEAISAALRSARSVQEPGYADSFRFIVAYNRSPVVLDALLAVAEDPAASIPMRIVAIEGALRQHLLGSGFGQRADVLATHPMGRFCRIVFVEDAGEYKSTAPLPADYRQSISSRLRRIAADPGAPQAVRDAARCTADHVAAAQTR